MTESVPRRYLLQALLEQISELPESKVHFQPPNGVHMSYPAIVYSRSRAETDYADNLPYRSAQAYSVTVIHADPDNVIRDQVAALPYCSYDRWYATDGLNHDVYTLYF